MSASGTSGVGRRWRRRGVAAPFGEGTSLLPEGARWPRLGFMRHRLEQYVGVEPAPIRRHQTLSAIPEPPAQSPEIPALLDLDPLTRIGEALLQFRRVWIVLDNLEPLAAFEPAPLPGIPRPHRAARSAPRRSPPGSRRSSAVVAPGSRCAANRARNAARSCLRRCDHHRCAIPRSNGPAQRRQVPGVRPQQRDMLAKLPARRRSPASRH